MNIIDKERQDILNRITEIQNTRADNMEIVDGNPISRELIPEYRSLKRMSEILDNNLAQDGIDEYNSRRNQTKLPPLPEEEISTFTNPMNQRIVERQLIVSKMKEIENNSKNAGFNTVRANDGAKILNDPKVIEEYNRLDTMRTIINKNFKMSSYYEYFKLRSESSLGPVTLGKYQAMVGRAPLPYEKLDTIETEVDSRRVEEVQVRRDDQPQETDDKALGEVSSGEPVSSTGTSEVQSSMQPSIDPNDMSVIYLPGEIYTPEKEEPKVENVQPVNIPVLTSRDLMLNALKEERSAIQTRKAEIKSSFTQGMSDIERKSQYSSKIMGGDFQAEYENLLRMETILDLGLKEENIQNYSKLRTQTALGNLDKSKIDTLLGKAEVKVEESLAVRSDPTVSRPIYDSNIVKENKYQPDYESLLRARSSSLSNINVSKNNYESGNNRNENESRREPVYRDIPPTEVFPWAPVEPAGEFKKGPLGSYHNPIETTFREDGREPTKQTENTGTDASKDEELFEVVKTTPWRWVNDHKKQILITLGLSALAIALGVYFTQLPVARETADMASEAAGYAAQMIKNSTLYHSSIASEKVALHSANVTLGNIIESITKIPVNYNTTTHLWTVGKETIDQFVTSSAFAAAQAAAKVNAITNFSLAAALGGLGTIGAGVLAPARKSKEYQDIKAEINNFMSIAHEKTRDEQANIAQAISHRIIASDRLSDKERMLLFKKISKAISKAEKLARVEVEKVEAEIVEEESKLSMAS